MMKEVHIMTSDTEIRQETEVETAVVPEKRDRFRFLREIKPKLLSQKNRKYLIIACSVVLLGGAVYLNWLFFSGDQSAEQPKEPTGGQVIDYGNQSESEDSYFAVAQINRQRARDEAIGVYQTVVNSEDALQELKDEALSGINRIAAQMEAEAKIETLVKSKGFEECVAVISDNNASIIVRSDALLPNEIAQIKEIAVEQSGIPVSGIKIVEVKD